MKEIKEIENKITKLELIDWKELKLYEFNDLSDESTIETTELLNGIVNTGFVSPFYVWENHRYVIDGKKRKFAIEKAEAEGYKIPELPVLLIRASNLQEAKKIVLMVSSRYGKITQKSFQNFISDLNINEIKNDIRLPEIKIDIAIPNFQIDHDFSKTETKKNIEDEIKEDEANHQSPITKFGDIWELNDHKIICGDSTKEETYQRLFGDKKASMIFTDPPYNLATIDFAKVGAKIHDNFAMASGEMKSEQFAEFLKDIFKNLVSYSTDGSIHYICMDWRHNLEMLNAGFSRYTEFKNLCVWAKDQPGQGAFYRSQHELVFVWKNGKAKHINNFEMGQFGRTRANVWKYPAAMSFANPDREREGNVTKGVGEFANHPTPKPVNMVSDTCLDCSKIGDIVLDVFLGSGTTLIACEETQRISYSIEILPKYVDSSVRRWIKLKEKKQESYEIKLNGEIFNFENI